MGETVEAVEKVVKVEDLVDYGFDLEQNLSEPIKSCDILNGSGIYAIVNKVNGKCYIGSAKCLKTRLSRHRSYLRSNSHQSTHLLNAYNKYGEDAFKFKILDITPYPEDLAKLEQMYFDLCKPKYNLYPNARTPLGSKHSEETKAKISAAHKGKKLSPQHCINNGLAKKGMKHSEEAKLKMSKAAKGRIFTEEHKRNMAIARKNVVVTGVNRRRSGAGIYLNASGKSWTALIQINKESIKLGSYPTRELALEARLEAERIYWNEDCTIENKLDLKNVSDKFTKNTFNRVSGTGIFITKANTYKVTISSNNKHKYIGTFKSYDEALKARLEAEAKYWNNNNETT